MSDDPNFYKQCGGQLSKHTDLEDIFKSWDNLVPESDLPALKSCVQYLVEHNVSNENELKQADTILRRQHKFCPKKSQLLHVYNMMVANGELQATENANQFRTLLTKKATKSQSGVLVVTVLTSPYPKFTDSNGVTKTQKFSCKWNCYYCPNEPGQPRSYLHDEPSVLRANRNDFDPVLQFFDRAATLAMNGHPIDKIEILVLGGTWASYPHQYQEEFIRDLFYAANTFWQRPPREERYSLLEEQIQNESATCKIIGITLETRPDCINVEEIRRFRRYGCTRVQLGVQHTNDTILKTINRGCYTQHTKNAIAMLKAACYKMDIHLMPNLPGASADLDVEMFAMVLQSPDLQVDQWKIYPCEVTPWTIIKKWNEEGKFTPYSDDELRKVLEYALPHIHPWIRVNRVVRDIPSQYILAGLNQPNLRQDMDKFFDANNIYLMDIRSREVKGESIHIDDVEIVVREYNSSDGREFFISVETKNRKKICGFVRLRIGAVASDIFPELEGCALIRELHVYGQLIATSNKKGTHAQHTGFGAALMATAENFAKHFKYEKVSVIAGVGVRNYYRKLGYLLTGDGQYMIKTFAQQQSDHTGGVPFAWSENANARVEHSGGLYVQEWEHEDACGVLKAHNQRLAAVDATA